MSITEHDRKELAAFSLFLNSYSEAVNLGISRVDALADAEREAYGPAGASCIGVEE